MPATLIRTWKSRGGKYWVELYADKKAGQIAYSYRTDSGGGFIGSCTFDEALAKAYQQASFCPSKMYERCIAQVV